MDYIENDQTPVFIINGFLEAGKTSFIAYTAGEDYFHIEGNTLLLICEEGETGYDKKLLTEEKIITVSIDDKEMLEPVYLSSLQKKYKAERILIEYNGMWGNPAEIQFPEGWVLYQQITVMDGSTLDTYLANMKALMGPMLAETELLLVNRCDGLTSAKLMEFKKKLRPMLQKNCTLVMEDEEGEIPLDMLPEELPYDVNADPIIIKPEDYGTWFMDAMDCPERYIDKTVQFTAMIMKDKRLSKGMFIPGRMAMTCCENDMRFLGYMAYYKNLDAFKDKDWVKLTAAYEVRELKEYNGAGPFLNVISMSLTGPISEPATFG